MKSDTVRRRKSWPCGYGQSRAPMFHGNYGLHRDGAGLRYLYASGGVGLVKQSFTLAGCLVS